MGVYIPNMSKPKDCKECQWHLDFYIEDKQVGGLCTITEKDDKKNTCPLIEIDDEIWENGKYKLIRMTEEQRVNKELAEMVTCGECKHWDKEEHDCNIRDSYGWNYKPTDFCSYGERRADEHNTGRD